MSNVLVNKFLKASFWSASEQVIFLLLSIVQLAITSRILTPIDFGVYAIAMFFSSLGSTAFSMGLGPALIQKQGDINGYFNTTWTISLIVSISAFIVLSVLSPFICKYYYNSPESLLPSIIMLFSIILNATTNPKVIVFLKELNFRKQFALRVFPRLLSFTLIIIFAYVLKSYWGLIIAILCESIFRFVYSYIIIPYRPKFDFNKTKFKELYSFGGWLQLKNVVNWLVSNVDVAVVGNVLGTFKLGLFNRAQSISSIPRNLINSIIDTVAFPLYSQLQSEPKKFSKAANAILDLSQCMVSYIIVFVALFGKDIVLLVLGEQWVELSEPFVILVISYSLQSLLFSFNPIIRAKGMTKFEFWFYIIKFIIMMIALYPMAKYYDLLGVSYAVLLSVFIAFPIMLVIISKKTSYKLGYFMRNIIFSFFVISITLFIGYKIVPHSTGFIWVLYAIGMSVVFVLIVLILGRFNIGYGNNIRYIINLRNK